ncbi:MAG: SDR family oxidoreductase [Caldilineaceae bacterium]|nr:SDR family oxidoreductase [Caldilineaceae bacterium]
MGRLEGKVAIITGGASGVGEAASRLFAAEGANLVIADIQGELASTLAQEIGGGSIAQEVDVSRNDDVENLVNKALESFGRLDVMFNNAGVGGAEGLIHETPEEVFDRYIAVNLKGVWLGIKHAISPMLEAGGGSIVNTASVSAHLGIPQQGAYGASKGGVVQLTRVAAVEYAESNIRVNAICPGAILTPLVYNNPDLDYKLDVEDAKKQLASAQPIPRACMPIDVANAALYLASDDSSFITGTTTTIDGGWTASGVARLANRIGPEEN